MTPTAVTNAGRAPAHRRRAPSRTSPSAPRRVSGPVRGRIAQPKPTRAPGVRRPARTPLTVRFTEYVRALPDHSLLDRVVRGRTWIALLGLMLAGIVAMQVEVLKLGASEGRALQESSALQSRNEILRASVSSLSSEQRIERLATSYGMVMPSPVDIVFLSPNATANANRAVHNITAPDPTSFIASLPQDQQTLDATGTAATGTGTTDSTSTALAPTTTDTTDSADPGATTDSTDSTAGTAGTAGTATGDTTSPTEGTTTVAPVTSTSPSTTDTSTSQPTDTGTSTGGGVSPAG